MEHDGEINGFKTHIYRNTELQQTIIILSNNRAMNIRKLKSEIMAVLKK